MKLPGHFHVALSCFLLTAAAPRSATGQERAAGPPGPAGDVETLQRLFAEQAAQIRELQATLERALEQQAAQQALLDALQHKLEDVSGSAVFPHPAGTTSPSATANQAVPAPETARAAASRPETVPAPTTDVNPEDVKAGFGKIKFSGLLQGWFLGGDGGFNDTFRVRRTELKFTGEIGPRVKWTAMVDPVKSLSLNNTFTTINGTSVVTDTRVNQASRVLQDAFITIALPRRMNLNVGQFKVPISLEGLQSSAGLDTERALFASDRARGGTYGDIRDLGVMLYGPLIKPVDYQIALLNGSGESQNDVDTSDQKGVAGRLVARPSFLQGLQVGGSGAWGNGSHRDRPRRDRVGGELLFVRGPLTLKGELMTGEDGPIHRRGYYGHFAYHFTPNWEGVLRVDTWDPDTGRESTAASVTERDYVTGFNYFSKDDHLKLQFNYVRKTFREGVVASRNLFLVNVQTWW